MDHVGRLSPGVFHTFYKKYALNARKTIRPQSGPFFVVGCAVGIRLRRWFQKDAVCMIIS